MLSSVLLHIAALVVAIVGCAFVLFARSGAEAFPLAVLWEQHRSLLFGVLVFSLCVMIALFSMAAGRKGRHMLEITIALWIVEAFALFCSALFLAVFPLHPAVIATDVLFFLAWTAQAILCTVLTARTKRLSKVRSASAAVQESSLA